MIKTCNSEPKQLEKLPNSLYRLFVELNRVVNQCRCDENIENLKSHAFFNILAVWAYTT